MAGSTAGQPQFIASTAGNPSYSNAPPIQNTENDQIFVPDTKAWKNFLACIGPGFLVSIAYIGPGNFATDLQTGAQYKFGSFWILLVASCAALIIQSLAVKLGVVTDKHLAELCSEEYPAFVNFFFWVRAEIAIVARVITEVIGTAVALNLLFGIPIWIGVLLTGLSTLALLALQHYGDRKLEALIAFLGLPIAACVFAELGYAKPDAKDLYGLFVPQLKENGAIGHAISLLGVMVIPHNLFLHSALVLSRNRSIPRSDQGIKEACRFYMIESGFALMVAFLINVSIISVSGAVCNSSNINPEDQASCQDLDLNKASFLLRNVLGSWSSKLFAIALLASGQSSTINGTYAGQYVIQGFLGLRLTPWIRIFLTRCLAIVPSLIIAAIGGSAGAGKLIIIASMIQSFELPYALIPLLKFTGSEVKMRTYANSPMITTITWVIGTLITVINIYYKATSFIKFLLHSHLKLVEAVFLGIFGISVLAVCLAGMVYLVLRKNKEPTHRLALTTPESRMANEPHNASMYSLPREDMVRIQLPQTRGSIDVE